MQRYHCTLIHVNMWNLAEDIKIFSKNLFSVFLVLFRFIEIFLQQYIHITKFITIFLLTKFFYVRHLCKQKRIPIVDGIIFFLNALRRNYGFRLKSIFLMARDWIYIWRWKLYKLKIVPTRDNFSFRDLYWNVVFPKILRLKIYYFWFYFIFSVTATGKKF